MLCRCAVEPQGHRDEREWIEERGSWPERRCFRADRARARTRVGPARFGSCLTTRFALRAALSTQAPSKAPVRGRCSSAVKGAAGR